LTLSRNVFFYKKIDLPDNFETRIYLMFIHFSIMMIIFKKKKSKFDQQLYDLVFNKIENDLRELGYGDVTVNKKMKDLNKILYDILLKIELNNDKNKFTINQNLIFKYFSKLHGSNNSKYAEFELYLTSFFNFCFDIKVENMIRDAIKFKF
jgi:cytochrome b pre-mRNA-processing protein 3